MKTTHITRIALAATAALLASSALAQIKVGITLAATGPAASLGIPQKNTVALLPKEVAGQKIEYLVLDDASDTATAVKNTRKLITEDKVDVMIGSSITPNSLAMIDVVAENETPMISMAASAQIVEPVDAKRAWVFKTPQDDAQMASAIGAHMAGHGIKTVALIGFSTAYGDSWIKEFSKVAEARNLKIVANERYAPTDQSVTGQVLKVTGANPDAVLILGSGTPAALPVRALKERGYKGKLYQTHGAANADFLRVCGKDCEGTYLPVGPILLADQLPDSNPIKKSAMEYKTAYEKASGGQVSSFGGYMWDASIILNHAVPEALKKAQPGTPAFRAALRDAIVATKDVATSQAVVNMTPTNHLGLDERSRVMAQIVDGKWKLQND
ncbi:MAG: ABC transporter substrate-binding protein [Burkholderiaceae bacterium]|nr:ABC transporter substrate-binding protein [Burkholderiaceae bacterium]